MTGPDSDVLLGPTALRAQPVIAPDTLTVLAAVALVTGVAGAEHRATVAARELVLADGARPGAERRAIHGRLRGAGAWRSSVRAPPVNGRGRARSCSHTEMDVMACHLPPGRG